MTGSSVYIVFGVIALIVVMLLFAVVDRVLKGGTVKQKPAEKKKEAPSVTAEQPASAPGAETKVPPVMKIYNSELADDLDKMINDAAGSSQQESRLKIENHMNKEKHIAEYIQEKHYHGFDFGDETSNNDEKDESMTFTREDYKKFMALSNIDDDKPL